MLRSRKSWSFAILSIKPFQKVGVKYSIFEVNENSVTARELPCYKPDFFSL